MTNKIELKSIGVMSGTSLDGLDIAACSFNKNSGKWNYEIIAAQTVKYNYFWQNKLANAHILSGYNLGLLNVEFGQFIGNQIEIFVNKNNLNPNDFIISSHGHTVFHQPEKNFTLQIGSGAHVYAKTRMKVVNNFRIQDVALGGQGAPLVPIGDALLFESYQACLNIGGFANCSFNVDNKRIAYDICPANIVLNELAKIDNKTYDVNGDIGRRGKVNYKMLDTLNKLEFYKENAPKSLGREWVEKNIYPIINTDEIDYYDIVATFYQHIAYQINQQLYKYNNILVTGGGAHNNFLMEKLNELNPNAWNNKDKMLIDFKEAVIFAFLGVLKMLNEDNILYSVTGAPFNHSSGCEWG